MCTDENVIITRSELGRVNIISPFELFLPAKYNCEKLNLTKVGLFFFLRSQIHRHTIYVLTTLEPMYSRHVCRYIDFKLKR